ncbi:FAD-dependent monooxygenase [Streptomyces monticola]|uniref:FAD-dependent monooxygenase n=2 Tax=Streptomyces monticola TaxID=2666263 RepID=A0ABW2JDQ2_9ACTN
MLAGELRIGGADVVVVDRRGAPTAESRASTLHARTMEILDCRGLLAALGTPPDEPRGHFGGIPLDLTLPGPYPGQWKVPQTRTEQLLQERARTLGADLRREHELRAVSVTADEVVTEVAGPRGPVRIRSRYVVGCDGEDSTLRRLTGAEFPGRDARRELLRADVAGIGIRDRRFERLPDGLAIAARRGDGVTRVMVHAFGSGARPRAEGPGFDEVVDAWKRVTGEDISHGTPLWVNAFGDASRQLTHYRNGRVLYAGDAAHQQMPIGGQALNLGLQDAVNLGWKLAATVRGGAPEGLLDSYHDERHAVGRRVLGNIGAQAALLLGGPEVEPLREVFADLIAHEQTRTELAGMISGLDIRYDVGDGRTDGEAHGEAHGGADPETGRHPLLGLRLPLVPLTTAQQACSTAELLRTGRGLLLDLTGTEGGDARLRSLAAPWAGRVDTVAAEPVLQGPLRGVEAVLVRPDGHIVCAGAADAPFPGALRRWFGAPDRRTHHQTEDGDRHGHGVAEGYGDTEGR